MVKYVNGQIMLDGDDVWKRFTEYFEQILDV